MKASLFVTCVVDQFYPEVGESTVRVLERLGVDVDFPRGQTCCGQPAFNAGYWSDARPLARRFIETFRGDRYVVAPSGSCVTMVRVFYDELLHNDRGARAKAQKLAPRVFELSEFIVDVMGISDLGPLASPAESEPLTTTVPRGLSPETRAGNHRAAQGPDAEPAGCRADRDGPGRGLLRLRRHLQREVPGHIGRHAAGQDRPHPGVGARRPSVACDSSCLMQIGGGLEKQGADVRPVHLARLIDERLSR